MFNVQNRPTIHQKYGLLKVFFISAGIPGIGRDQHGVIYFQLAERGCDILISLMG